MASKLATAIITGGAGFVGSHLADRLLADGVKVVVVDDLSTGRRENLADEADLEVLDVSDYDAFAKVAASARPDAIFHLAAQAMVTVSVKDPWFDCEINVKGTLNAVQAAREHRAPVVFTSTGGALYGDRAPIPTDETWYPEPLSPYGAAKWAGEAYVGTWGRADGLPHAICRLGNVYGPRQSPHGEAGVVAIISHRLWAGEEATLYGDGEPTRDYVHVTDVTDALVRAAGNGVLVNVSTGREVAVREIYDLISAEAGTGGQPELAPLRDGELARSGIDASLAERELGWKPQISVEEGVPQTYRALVEEFETRNGPE